MIILMVVVFLGLVFITKKTRNTIFDGFFFVMGPYVFIILLNNMFFIKRGFHSLSDTAIFVFFMTMLLFFVGSSIGAILASNSKTDKVYKLADINERTLRVITILSELIVIADILLHIVRFGISRFVSGHDTFNRSSLSAHITLLLVVLSIILFDYYIENRNEIDFLLFLVALGVIFASFTKYHIISTVLAVFIYIAIKRPEFIRIIGITTFILIAMLFIMNYVLGFIAANVTGVPRSFYLNHLWEYVAGGILNLDNAINYFGRTPSNLSICAWTVEMLTRFPTLITNKLFNYSFTNYDFHLEMIDFFLGAGSVSNVLCIPGAAYVQGNIFSFSLFIILWGAVVEYVFFMAKKTQSVRTLLTASIFLAFCMLSFFASFFELSGPWETILIAYLVVPLLRIKCTMR